MHQYVTYGGLSLLCGVVSAKWALELGYNQPRQLIWGLGGLVLGPLIPLFLYIRLLYKSLGKKV